MNLKPGFCYFDTAVGSRELEEPLAALGAKPRPVARLPADFEIVGCGRDGQTWRIGVERKTLSDLGSSLLMDRLFGTQLPRMLKEYDRIWLIVEGVFRRGGDDCIEVWGWDVRARKQGWVPSRVPLSWSQLQGWMMSYDEAVSVWKAPTAGLGHGRRWRTGNVIETAAWLAQLLRWWSKPYHRHSGHLAIEEDRPMNGGRIHAMLHQPTRVQKAAYVLPEIGALTAKRIGRRFNSLQEFYRFAADAGIEEWREAGLGKKDSETVCKEIMRRYR